MASKRGFERSWEGDVVRTVGVGCKYVWVGTECGVLLNE